MGCLLGPSLSKERIFDTTRGNLSIPEVPKKLFMVYIQANSILYQIASVLKYTNNLLVGSLYFIASASAFFVQGMSEMSRGNFSEVLVAMFLSVLPG